jgi:hypothetical protein
MKIAFITFFIIAGIAVLIYVFKSRQPLKNLFTSVFQGIASMMAVNVLGLITGVTIAVNWYTLLTASLFGIPSVITIVLLDAFLI